jgi:uridine kinase
LLDPAAPEGSGRVALCSIDPLTQIDHSATLADLPTNGGLIVDGVFAFRPQFDPCGDLRIWVHIDPELSVRRGMARDAGMYGGAEQAEGVHRDRYLAAETIYIDELDPMTLAEVVVDNTDFDRPLLIRG